MEVVVGNDPTGFTFRGLAALLRSRPRSHAAMVNPLSASGRLAHSLLAASPGSSTRAVNGASSQSGSWIRIERMRRSCASSAKS